MNLNADEKETCEPIVVNKHAVAVPKNSASNTKVRASIPRECMN